MDAWHREQLARARLRATTLSFAALAGLAFVGFGGWIFYNTNVLNRYENATDGQRHRVDYENAYKRFAAEPQPKIVAVKVDVDLYPSEQRVRVRGSYTLTNRGAAPVTVLQLNFAAGQSLVIRRLELGVANRLAEDNAVLGVRRYQLESPLAPGASTTLAFDLELPTHGFKNEGSNTSVVYNGSFVNGRLVLPGLGDNADTELERDHDRRKFGLAPKERLRDRDDPQGLMVNGLDKDADYVAFETTLTTDSDQIAIAPGYLQREWLEGDRRHFHYKMDAPIANFFSFQSGRYEVRKDVWHRDDGSTAGDVPIEIYYQKGHEFNLDSMLASTKTALSYNSKKFGQGGSRTGAPTLGFGGFSKAFALARNPRCHRHVSSPRHVERSRRISRTTLSCVLHNKVYVTDDGDRACLNKPFGRRPAGCRDSVPSLKVLRPREAQWIAVRMPAQRLGDAAALATWRCACRASDVPK